MGQLLSLGLARWSSGIALLQGVFYHFMCPEELFLDSLSLENTFSSLVIWLAITLYPLFPLSTLGLLPIYFWVLTIAPLFVLSCDIKDVIDGNKTLEMTVRGDATAATRHLALRTNRNGRTTIPKDMPVEFSLIAINSSHYCLCSVTFSCQNYFSLYSNPPQPSTLRTSGPPTDSQTIGHSYGGGDSPLSSSPSSGGPIHEVSSRDILIASGGGVTIQLIASTVLDSVKAFRRFLAQPVVCPSPTTGSL